MDSGRKRSQDLLIDSLAGREIAGVHVAITHQHVKPSGKLPDEALALFQLDVMSFAKGRAAFAARRAVASGGLWRPSGPSIRDACDAIWPSRLWCANAHALECDDFRTRCDGPLNTEVIRTSSIVAARWSAPTLWRQHA